MKFLRRLDDLEYIVKHYKVGKVVVTCDMPEEMLNNSSIICKGQGVSLIKFDDDERVIE